MMEGTLGAVLLVLFSRRHLEGGPKAHRVLALGGCGGIIKAKHRTAAWVDQFQFHLGIIL